MGRFKLKRSRQKGGVHGSVWQMMFTSTMMAHVRDEDGFNWCVELDGVRYLMRVKENPDGSLSESWRYESGGEWQAGVLQVALDQCGPDTVVWMVSPETTISPVFL